ncbi:MAG: type II toxin-antitoxin system prevent-host-death family antitoxin [Kineosporiaceae bacterium]|nr:type II toxin-antitoxin system prevent-host-death family antitoxin [Aeromicrobium sp.]
MFVATRDELEEQVCGVLLEGDNAVLMSEEDYEAWQTTLYLFSTPTNARRLSEALGRSDAGTYTSRELDRT